MNECNSHASGSEWLVNLGVFATAEANNLPASAAVTELIIRLMAWIVEQKSVRLGHLKARARVNHLSALLDRSRAFGRGPCRQTRLCTNGE